MGRGSEHQGSLGLRLPAHGAVGVAESTQKMPRWRNAPGVGHRRRARRRQVRAADARTRTPPRRRSYRRRSPSNLLERLSDLFRCKSRQLIRRDSDKPVAAALQAHFTWRYFDLQTAVSHLQLEHLAWPDPERVAQRLAHAEASPAVDR